MAKLGIIRNGGIEEIVFEEDRPKLLFGLSSADKQRKERRSIGFALRQTGLEVYATDVLWPNDSYVSNNGLVIAERDFGELAHGGNYIFGDGFVLVSTSIKEDLEQRLKDSEHFGSFFAKSEVIFVPPYWGIIEGQTEFVMEPSHIDRTVGYVPKVKLLTIDGKHYKQKEALFDQLGRRFGIDIKVTNHDGELEPNISIGWGYYQQEGPLTLDKELASHKRMRVKYGPDIEITSHDNHLPNNFFVVQYNEDVFVIANRYNNPFKGGNNGFRVIETNRNISNLPLMAGGSVKCAANIAPTTKLWDALGIEYRRWGVNPNQANYQRS